MKNKYFGKGCLLLKKYKIKDIAMVTILIIKAITAKTSMVLIA